MHKLTIVWLTIIFVSLMGYSLSPGFATATPVSAAESPSSTNGVLPDGLTLLKEDSWAEPEDAIAVGDWLLFRQGTELWKSDGTVTGTVVVAQNIFPFGMQACNGQLYFRHANELLRVDAAGEKISPSGVKGEIRGPWSSATVQCSSSKLFFVDSDAQYGQELWQTDTQTGRTSLVKDINPGRNGSGIEELFLFKDNVLFSAYDDQAGDALWRSDGTVTGTLSLTTLPGPVTEFASTEQSLFFKVGCCQLWRADDALTSAALVKDFGAEQFTEMQLHPTHNFVYITANQRPLTYTPALKGELWRSDGTSQGTAKLKQLQHIARDYGTHIVGDQIIFAGGDLPDDYTSHWYVSDGTSSGTTTYSLNYPANFPTIALPQFPNQIFVTSAYAQQFWRTDGTVEGTVELPTYMEVGRVQQFGNLFAYTDGNHHPVGLSIGVSDGTPEGTRILFDFSPGGSNSKIQLKNVSDILFMFVYDDQGKNSGLWAYRAPASLQSSNVYLPVVSSH